MTTVYNNTQWFWLGVRRLYIGGMSSALSRFGKLAMSAFVGAVLCTPAYAQTQGVSANAPPSGVSVAQPYLRNLKWTARTQIPISGAHPTKAA